MTQIETFRSKAPESDSELFILQQGIEESQIADLILYTQQEVDPIKLDGDEYRFMTREQYDEWRRKGREIYTLNTPKGTLRGIFWAGKKPLPDRDDYTVVLNPDDYQHTYAFRLYDSARGKGISHNVLQTCMTDYLHRFQTPIGFWLEVSGLNPAALHMDQKMEFKIASGKNNEGRLILINTYGF